MSNFDFVINHISQIQKEIGLSNYSGFFEMAINEVPKIAAEKKLPIDLYYARLSLPEIRNGVKELKVVSKYKFNSSNEVSVQESDRFPELQPSVAILLIDDDFLDEQLLNKMLSKKMADYRLLVVFDYSSSTEDLQHQIKSKLHSKTEIEYTKVDRSLIFDIADAVEKAVQARDVNKLLEISKLQVIRPLIASTADIVAVEMKIANTQKALTSQDNAILRKEDNSSVSSEVSNSVRSIIQQHVLDVEKGFKTKYEDFNKPNTGQFSIEMDTFSKQLSFEDIELHEIAEKSEKFETKIVENKIQEFHLAIAKNIKAETTRDQAYLKIVFSDAIKKINLLLKEKGLPLIDADKLNPSAVDAEKILMTNNYYQRIYSGEVTKEGVMEYFIALRDYTGIIMVVVGLLAPLTMLSSTPDIDQGSFLVFINALSIHLKKFKVIVQFITLITIAFMIVYGFFDLRKRIPRKREEEKNREARKARENIVTEGKRIYADSSRDWISLINNQIKEFAQSLSAEVESVLRKNMQSKQQLVGLKRNEVQLSQQSIDLKIRSIQNAEKKAEQMNKQFTELSEKLDN